MNLVCIFLLIWALVKLNSLERYKTYISTNSLFHFSIGFISSLYV